jgi:hypothetical protein
MAHCGIVLEKNTHMLIGQSCQCIIEKTPIRRVGEDDYFGGRVNSKVKKMMQKTM